MRASPPPLRPWRSETDPVGELILAYRCAKALFLGAETDLFRLVEETDGRAPSVARASRLDPLAAEILLDALTGSGFLKKTAGRYRNTPYARRCLHPEGPASVAENLRYQEFLSSNYADLLTTLRNGRPRTGLRELLARRPGFVRHYIRGMADIAARTAGELARALPLSGRERMLDAGCGPGAFLLACLGRDRDLRATALDLPETLRLTRRIVGASPHAGRVEFQPGDYHTADFGRARYGLVLLSHVTHDEGPAENLHLIRKSHAALRPGGIVVIHDFLTRPDRTAPLYGALFSLHLAAYTGSGRTYSSRDYASWLAAAGFSRPRTIPLRPGAANATTAVVATKR